MTVDGAITDEMLISNLACALEERIERSGEGGGNMGEWYALSLAAERLGIDPYNRKFEWYYNGG